MKKPFQHDPARPVWVWFLVGGCAILILLVLLLRPPQQAPLLPAQKLLDYGHALLDPLRPGMVYVGGTDSGRWVAELMNETSGGERHVVLTQNALADSSYLDYLGLQYDDRMTTLTDEDSQRAFQDYL